MATVVARHANHRQAEKKVRAAARLQAASAASQPLTVAARRRTEALVSAAARRRVRRASLLGNALQKQYSLVYLWPALLSLNLDVWDLGPAGFLSLFRTSPHPLHATRLRCFCLMTQLP